MADGEAASPSSADEENSKEEYEDEEELLACANCFSTIIWREDILQEKISSCKEVVYPYELTVCDRESWCYLATDHQNQRFDLIRARQPGSALRLVASPRDDFTWFPGYAWRAAHCEECQANIGWGFCAPFQCGASGTGSGDSVDSSSKLWNMAPDFYGLILTRLRPSSKAKAQARHRQYRETPVPHVSFDFSVSGRPPAEIPPWWTWITHRGESTTPPSTENVWPRADPGYVDWLGEDPEAAFRRARSPTPPMRVGVRSSSNSNSNREDSDMQSELLRLLREQARVNRSLRMHQFGTPSNVQHIIPLDGDPASPVAPAPGTPQAPAPQPPLQPPAETEERPTEASNEAPDSGLFRWLQRLLQSRVARRGAGAAAPEEESSNQETLNAWRQRRRESSPPRTWNLIRQLSSQQQQLAAVRDSLLSEQLESSRHVQLSLAEEQVNTHQRTLNQLRELSVRQQQLAAEQRQLMEDIIRLQGTVAPSQGQL